MNDYHRENMRKHIAFLRDNAEVIRKSFDMEEVYHSCGSPSCSIGFMPLSIGIAFPKSDFGTPMLGTFIRHVIGLDLDKPSNADHIHYMFGSHWADINNTPEAAAARMEAVLYDQVPMGWGYVQQFSHPIVIIPEEFKEEVKKLFVKV